MEVEAEEKIIIVKVGIITTPNLQFTTNIIILTNTTTIMNIIDIESRKKHINKNETKTKQKRNKNETKTKQKRNKNETKTKKNKERKKQRCVIVNDNFLESQ